MANQMVRYISDVDIRECHVYVKTTLIGGIINPINQKEVGNIELLAYQPSDHWRPALEFEVELYNNGVGNIFYALNKGI